MGSFGLSDGTREPNSVIDRKIREAKARKKEQLQIDDALFCERCGSNQGNLSMSHIMSVKECKESGRSEISYDIDDLELLCEKHHLAVEALTKAEREEMYFERKLNENE